MDGSRNMDLVVKTTQLNQLIIGEDIQKRAKAGKLKSPVIMMTYLALFAELQGDYTMVLFARVTDESAILH